MVKNNCLVIQLKYNLSLVPVSLIGKVSCRRVRVLDSNPAYTKNQFVSWPDGKSNHHERTP